MEQDQQILKELVELESSLAGVIPSMPYQVPDGYFQHLASAVLARINMQEPKEELALISPMLSQAPKDMPYKVPAGYFDSLETGMIAAVISSQRSDESLEQLSPLLAGLSKDMPYSVPSGYFEHLPAADTKKEVVQPAGKVVWMTSRKWFRFAAAAMIVGAICTTVIFSMRQGTIDPGKDSYSWVKKNMKPVSTDEMKNFIQLTDETLEEKEAVASVVKSQEVEDLVKDVSTTDLQEFLSEIPADETTSADDIMMN